MDAIELERFRGTGQFGPAYRAMFENDVHAPGSVDRVLVEQMVRLCPETAEYLYSHFTPKVVRYTRGSRPELEQLIEQTTAECRGDEERVAAIARFCASLVVDAPESIEEMLFGGTEEEIIRRGSDWCTDVARVACVLYQIVGLPARRVQLADLARAYSGHAIVEIFRSGCWGAVDPLYATIYTRADGWPATSWDLVRDPELVVVQGHHPDQFRGVALSNYFIADHRAYDYTVTRLNPYYRSLLTMAERGWPGGLRWLHGE